MQGQPMPRTERIRACTIHHTPYPSCKKTHIPSPNHPNHIILPSPRATADVSRHRSLAHEAMQAMKDDGLDVGCVEYGNCDLALPSCFFFLLFRMVMSLESSFDTIAFKEVL